MRLLLFFTKKKPCTRKFLPGHVSYILIPKNPESRRCRKDHCYEYQRSQRQKFSKPYRSIPVKIAHGHYLLPSVTPAAGPPDRAARNRQNCHHGTDCLRMWNRTCCLYYYASYPPECCRSPCHCKKEFSGKRIFRNRIHHERDHCFCL